MPLIIAAVIGLGMLTLLLIIVVGPFILVMMPKINAAITMERRLADLESRVDRLASQLTNISTSGAATEIRAAAPAAPASPPRIAPGPIPASTAAAAAAPAMRSPDSDLQASLGSLTLPPGLAPATQPWTRIAAPAAAPAPATSGARQTSNIGSPTHDAVQVGLDIEETLGANWLNKIGASILVLGIALFLGYELGKVGPAGKVLVGYFTAAALLGAGMLLERRDQYRLFSRGSTGAGWALMFFTTYAINHVPAARILSSTTLDLVLMLVVAGAMVAHTLRYRSQTVTSLAFLLAFLTVTISHDTVFSLSAGAVLACAAVVIANRMQWFMLETGAIAATYLNHYVWLQPVVEAAHHQLFPQFWISTFMLAIYWAVFRTAYIVRRPETTAKEQWSTAAAILNPALLLMIARYQAARPDVAFWALLAVGAAEAISAQLLRTRQRRTAFVTLTAIGTTMLVAALPFRFGGTRLSILWLAEAEALVFIAALTRDRLFHRLGILTAAIVGEQILALAAAAIGAPAAIPAEATGRALGLTLLTAAGAFYVNGHFVPRRWPDLFVHQVDETIATCFSCVASVFVLLAAWYELTSLSVALAWAFVGLILVEVGLRSRTLHLRLQGYAALALSFARVYVVNLNAVGAPGLLSPRVYSIVPLVLAYAWMYWRLDLVDRHRGAPEFAGFAPHAFSYMATLATASLAWSELPAERLVIGWAMMVVALLLAATLFERRVFVGQAMLGALAASARGIFHNLYGRSYFDVGFLASPEFSIGLTAGLLLAALPLAFRLRDHSHQTAPHWLLVPFDRRPEQTVFFAAFALITLLLKARLPAGVLTVGWGLEAVAVFLFALPVRERSFRVAALGLLVVCVARIVTIDAWSLDPRDRYLTFIGLGAVLLAVSFLYSRYRELVREYL